MADPEFTVEPFNFEQEVWESYARYIERLRNQVAVRYSHNRPVTPIEVNPPTRFFDIVLRTNSSSVRIRIRRDNLYLVGYQMEGSNQWLELRYTENNEDNPAHRITGSVFLRFGDSYDRLVTAAGVATLSSIQVGRQELIDAINTLATSQNDAKRANSLLVVIFMILESARFRCITEYFVKERTAGGQIPDWIQYFVRGWTDLSFPLLHADADNSFRLPENNRFNVFTFEAAAALAGLLKGRFFGPPRQRRAADDHHDIYPRGRPLVEVFSVTIDNINGNSNVYGDINGTIQVSDGLGDEYAYNMISSQLIRAGETVVLNGPARCISAYDNFTINVTLTSKEGLSEDNEISKGKIAWDVRNVSTNVYDKFLSQRISGRFGAATVAYAVLSDAVVAKVEITLIKGNGQPTSVYGLITSHNVSLNTESVLFEKTQKTSINVNPGNLIPLSRLAVAVPLDSTFIVRADLKGANIFSSEDVIALGTATFSPQLSGISEQNINGTNGNYIRVKVSWSWYV